MRFALFFLLNGIHLMIDRIIAFVVLCLVLSIPLGIAITFTGEVMLKFVFFWPLFMSAIWISGGIYFWFNRERHWKIIDKEAPHLEGQPLISILIPCYNEGPNVRETLLAALNQRYPNVEVIAINDGSTDNTADELNVMAQQHQALRVIHLKQNQGKATALQAGAAAAKSDYLVCIDGDALLDRDAAVWLVKPMIDHPRVGAVTGNPRVRTRSTLVGRIQVGEFSSIIGLIKRTQRVYGQVFTVSGVVAAFNRRALAEVGYWSNDMITEDIDVSWKLQLHHWSIFFEPRAICWILMPETLRGLWKQRLRWAQGGAEVFLKNLRQLWSWQYRRMWVLFAEFCCSVIWSFTFSLSIILFLLGMFLTLPENIRVYTLFPPGYTGLVLAATCLIQFTVSLVIERRYEKHVASSLFWVIWYPMVYWMLNLFTTLVSFPKVMLKVHRKRARWESPDRGIERIE
ncbi:Biofilm synthesis N-glycosyltransferase [Xenorhabdus thuongxuanensis]|uniref:Poly-beta-1,6-N-acetyl-D-glucosamine synthase n=2 Tax=Xenorhabdus thuongxuanensis TaxID=1873484 RepID=A0A1Q5U8D4_9GAMM|nr:Biofilm synthesis N-glycosyltransferase [Xenorhabdus thuongxuanensis]